MRDPIERQEAIDAIGEVHPLDYNAQAIKSRIEQLPSAQPDNQINLCDSCDYSYPDCPSKPDDVIFGNGIGNDNICACNKYKPVAQSDIVKDLVTIFQNSKDMKLIARDGDLRADPIVVGRMPFEWTPCSLRLPEDERKTYWVCTDTGYQCECRWTNVNPIWTDLTTDWHWNIFDTPQYTKVVAWMPLPEPFKEK